MFRANKHKSNNISNTNLFPFFENKSELHLQMEEVAGYKKQLEQLIREAFYSHAMGEYAYLYGIQHPKGVLLYGPPGTGKTNIARGISKSFSYVTVINGPELKHEHVGHSERKLREIFSNAIDEWKSQGFNSNLHIFIFDEIDALFPKRSNKDNSGAERSDNSMTSQFLTLLDGVDSPQNILIIGTTNRKEAIDPALLRSGRLEVHIEISLPNEKDRLEILKLKTFTMKKNNLLNECINLGYWAKETVDFTGADIEYLVKKAAQFAMERNLNYYSENNKVIIKNNVKNIHELTKVTQADFQRSFDEVIKLKNKYGTRIKAAL